MLLYLIIIIFCMTMIVIFNIACNIEMFLNSIWIVILSVVGAVVIEIIIDLIFAGIIHSQKDSKFQNKKFFEVGKKERRFYEKLQIRKWKDKILELGAIGGFSKSKLQSQNDLQYINRFLIECNKGVIVHICDIVFGFLLLAIPPYKWTLCVALPVVIVNTILNILPIMVLRYNVPKLQVAKLRLQKKTSQSECYFAQY